MNSILVAAIVALHVSVAFADDIAKELVERAVARDEGVTSGRIKWVDGSPRGVSDKPYFQSFSHDDWVVGGRSYGGVDDWGHPVLGWYKGQAVKYVGDRTVDLNRSNAKPAIEVEDSRRSTNVTLPRWAGGFYSRKMKQWAKRFPEQFHFVADDVVDGIPVKLVEAETTDRAAFRYLDVRQSGGKIRLFIAPQLGYVIPRAEERTLDGSLRVRFEASDFSEKSPGIWFPTLVQDVRDEWKYYVKFLDVQMLNQEIPASDFVITIPKDVGPLRLKGQ